MSSCHLPTHYFLRFDSQATVELQGTHTRGMLVVDKRYWLAIEKKMKKNVEIIESVDIEKVKLLMKRSFGHEGIN